MEVTPDDWDGCVSWTFQNEDANMFFDFEGCHGGCKERERDRVLRLRELSIFGVLGGSVAHRAPRLLSL